MYISKRQLKCFILLLPIFKPIYIDYISRYIHFYTLLQSVTITYIIVHLLKVRKSCSIMSILAIVMQTWILISTIVGNGYISEAFELLLSISYTFLLFDYYNKQFVLLLKLLMVHAELCVHINLLTLLIAPDGFLSRSNSAYGMTQEWFLGADAYFIMWILPALMIAWIYAYVFYNNKRAIIISLASIITEIIRGSGTGIVAISIFFIVMLLPIIKNYLTPFRSSCIGVIIFLYIIIFRKSKILVPILDLLGKDWTFTGRLTIWDSAIKSIIENPILGYGVLTNDNMVNYLGRSLNGIWIGATHCHCHFLQIAFQGGLVAFILMGIIIGIDVYKCSKLWPNKIAKIAGISIAIYMIMGITEVLSFSVTYMIFPLVNLACDWRINSEIYTERKTGNKAI